MNPQYIRQLYAAAVIMAILRISSLAATNYVSLDGNHVWPFATWNDAATNIQSAVDAAGSGDTVLVADDGIYTLQAEIVVATNIVVRSTGGPRAAIIDGNNSTRCFRLVPHAGCDLRGFQIINGIVSTNEAGSIVWAAWA